MDAPPRAGVRAPRGRVSGMDGPCAARGRPGPPEGAPVSIIVPTWNEAKCLPALLDSLRAQTRSPAEILVADSGSTDGTQELAQARGAIVLEGERKGPGEGRNRGARAARGDRLDVRDAEGLGRGEAVAASG